MKVLHHLNKMVAAEGIVSMMALLGKVAVDAVDIKATIPLIVTSINSSLQALTGWLNEAEGRIS